MIDYICRVHEINFNIFIFYLRKIFCGRREGIYIIGVILKPFCCCRRNFGVTLNYMKPLFNIVTGKINALQVFLSFAPFRDK